MPSSSDDDFSEDNDINDVLWQNENTVISVKGPPNLSRNVSGFQRDILTSTMQNPNQSVYQMSDGSMHRRDISPISSVNNLSHFDNASYQNRMGNQWPSFLRRRSSHSSLSMKDTSIKRKAKQALTLSSINIKSNEDADTKTFLAQSHLHPIVEEDIITCVPNGQNWRIEKANDVPIKINITNSCRKTNACKRNFKILSPIVEEDIPTCVPNDLNWCIEKANDEPIKINITNACRKTNPCKPNFKISPIVEEDIPTCVPNDLNWCIEKANDEPIKINITNACRKTNPRKRKFKNVESSRRSRKRTKLTATNKNIKLNQL